jgi:hypothetical protein
MSSDEARVDSPKAKPWWLDHAPQFCVTTGIGFLLAISGAFGTMETPLVVRLAYWIPIMVVGSLIGWVVSDNRAVDRLSLARLVGCDSLRRVDYGTAYLWARPCHRLGNTGLAQCSRLFGAVSCDRRGHGRDWGFPQSSAPTDLCHTATTWGSKPSKLERNCCR